MWLQTEDGHRYSIDRAMRCLLCEGCVKAESSKTIDWYCISCRKMLDDARLIVLGASKHTSNNRIAHYLADPVGYQELVELTEAQDWLQKQALLREAEQYRAARV